MLVLLASRIPILNFGFVPDSWDISNLIHWKNLGHSLSVFSYMVRLANVCIFNINSNIFWVQKNVKNCQFSAAMKPNSNCAFWALNVL